MVSTTDIDTFASHHQEGAPLIDVREPHGYIAGHVPGARLIPWATSLPPRMSRPRGPPSS
ncbi:rhodanese-like domain-containing protein [Dietzia maris]|uniref:Rhodanese-like domain-containing protein n=1 Tax=Dietzia maris TaxID=37915 RepID=A0AAE4QZ12_9ACTN|nr:rhodanese-like domain-containing protein [Dietzia maris]MDV6299274.1 rhodanese-like domain-containing protein [Dietzia maris]